MTAGVHDFAATAFTKDGAQIHSVPVRVTAQGVRPTMTPTPAPVLWISNLTLYKEVPRGVNEVWVDVQPNSRVQHVDVYVDGYPAGFATGPGFRVNPSWTPTLGPTNTPAPTNTLEPSAVATVTAAAATAQVQQTKVAKAAATKAARAAAVSTAVAAAAAATAASKSAAATMSAATASSTPGPATNTPRPTATATFVRYQPLLDPMLGDYVARCVFPPGRHRIVAIGYDATNIEVGRDESWVVVK